MNNVFKLTAIGALAAASMEAQASTTFTAEYDTVDGISDGITFLNTSISDILVENYDPNVTSEYNGGIAYSVIADTGTDSAITTLTVPTISDSNFYLAFKNNSDADIGIGSVTHNGDSLTMTFVNANFAFDDGHTLEFEIYDTIEGSVLDLDFLQSLDVAKQETAVLYANGEKGFVSLPQALTSSMGYVDPNAGPPITNPGDNSGGTSLPEPSSVLFITMATLPLIFRRKRT